MNRADDVYDVREWANPGEQALYYVFVSEGKRKIIKMVKYQYVKQFKDRPLYNLGFGDLDHETSVLSDHVMSGNDDQYKVFNTVLKTVQMLFDVYKDSVLLVRGSDSAAGFIENCKTNCDRKCDNDSCRKAHRRINIYTHFVNKHFEILNRDFAFQGVIGMDDLSLCEPYKKGEVYKGVIIEKRLN